MTPRPPDVFAQYGLPYPPEVRALLYRGLTYYRAGIRATGRPPQTWRVTPEDYRLLTRFDSPSTPMEAFRIFGMRVLVGPSDEPPPTPLPPSWRELLCQWEAWHMTQGEAVNPLPPLEDLDEGLHCCGHVFATFAEYLLHRRKHEDG